VTERPFGVDVSALGAVYIARLDSDVARGTVPLDSLDGTIAVGSTPRDVAFSPDGATAYVTNEFSSSVSVVDASTHATVDQVTVTGSPFRVKVNSAGDRVYVSGNADSVFVIDPSVPAVIAAVGVDLDPNGMALSPDDGFLYVSSNSGTSIVEIATATNAIARTFPLGEVRSQDLAVSADGATLYVAMETSGRIRVIDLATGIEGAPIPLAGAAPFGLALAPSGAQLYVTGGLGSGSVHVIDVATGASRAIFLGGQPRRVAFGPDGSFAFVTNEVGWVDVMR
jgi:YVTN family beta-propeller protein